MAICKCPAAAALPNIPNFTCAESFGQIQKVAFQRLYKSTGEKNSFTTTAGIGKKASWTPLLSADDDTKVVVSPYIQAPTAEAGAPRTFGGGNETLGGIEEIIGREPTPFTAAQLVHCKARKQKQRIILFQFVLCLSGIKHWEDLRHPIATQYNGCFYLIGRMIWLLSYRKILTR